MDDEIKTLLKKAMGALERYAVSNDVTVALVNEIKTVVCKMVTVKVTLDLTLAAERAGHTVENWDWHAALDLDESRGEKVKVVLHDNDLTNGEANRDNPEQPYNDQMLMTRLSDALVTAMDDIVSVAPSSDRVDFALEDGRSFKAVILAHRKTTDDHDHGSGDEKSISEILENFNTLGKTASGD